MGSQGLEGCSTPIGAVSTMRGTEVMESLFSDVSSAAYVGLCFPAHPVTFWGAKARPFYPFPNRSLRTNFGLSVLYNYIRRVLSFGPIDLGMFGTRLTTGLASCKSVAELPQFFPTIRGHG